MAKVIQIAPGQRINNFRKFVCSIQSSKLDKLSFQFLTNAIILMHSFFCNLSFSQIFLCCILGLECLPTVNLPTGCFCTSGPTPTPYIPLVDILEEISSKAIPVDDVKSQKTMDCSTNQKGIFQN